MIIKGLSSVRISLKIPRDQQDAIDQLRRGSLSAEVERYMKWVVQQAAGRAVDAARWRLLTGKGMKPITPLSGYLRRNASRQEMLDHPLYDTGTMYKGIYAEVTGLSFKMGVRGPHAYLASIHEYGATFRVTPSTWGHFFSSKSMDASAWARRNMNQTVDIPKRPFLTPAMDDVMRHMQTDPRFNIAAGVLNIWAGSKKTGNTRTEYGFFTRGQGGMRISEYEETRPEVSGGYEPPSEGGDA